MLGSYDEFGVLKQVRHEFIRDKRKSMGQNQGLESSLSQMVPMDRGIDEIIRWTPVMYNININL